MSVKELQEKNLGARRNFHDDITIIVIDNNLSDIFLSDAKRYHKYFIY